MAKWPLRKKLNLEGWCNAINCCGTCLASDIIQEQAFCLPTVQPVLCCSAGVAADRLTVGTTRSLRLKERDKG